MIKQTYHLTLATPAFLGGADQRGTWRTPPIKALIREWWRIAVARDVGYRHAELKQHETALFGTAADEAGGDNRQSRIRLALAHWHEGQCKAWPAGESRVTHPEVKDRNTGKPRPVGSELYLGFGPLTNEPGTGTRLKKEIKDNAALQAGEDNQFSLALPDTEQADLHRALTLAHWFGTIGGRSRNGWGSLLWTAAEGSPALPALSRAALENSGCTRPLRQCLDLDWPHAIGSDGIGVLVWRSREAFRDWHEAMTFLARTKIAFRHHLGFVGGQPHREAQPRHALAYPVTNHKVPAWEGQGKGRLANTLRFKLHSEADGRLRAVIYHTPCRPPSTLPHNLDLLDTWQRVHRFLDAQPTLARLD